jgi:hypothetical protein
LVKQVSKNAPSGSGNGEDDPTRTRDGELRDVRDDGTQLHTYTGEDARLGLFYVQDVLTEMAIRRYAEACRRGKHDFRESVLAAIPLELNRVLMAAAPELGTRFAVESQGITSDALRRLGHSDTPD